MGPRSFWEVKVPRFLDIALEGGRFSVIRTDRPSLATGVFWYSFLEAESTSGTWNCRMPWKNSPVTPPGIDHETYQLVSQCLNHYATPGPM
jgi:hypothetical protein